MTNEIVEKPVNALPAPLIEAANKAREYAEASLSDATRRRYASAWRGFVEWCLEHDANPLPAEPELVAAYFAAAEMRPQTLGVVSAAIRLAHTSQGHDDPTKSEAVRLTLRGIRRTHGVATHGRRALRLAELQRILSECGDGFAGQRDAALLLVGFVGGMRRAELAAMDWSHLREEPEGLVITIPRSKTDQEGEGRTVALPYGRSLLTCPVRTLHRWRAHVGGIMRTRLVPDPGAVWLSQRSLRRLPASRIATVLQDRAEAAGIDTKLLAAHSLRVGFATEAALAGASERAIARQTGHRDVKTLRKYIRDGTVFSDNAAAKLDL